LHVLEDDNEPMLFDTASTNCEPNEFGRDTIQDASRIVTKMVTTNSILIFTFYVFLRN
jgi:hypothetical protein